ncbi:uncharacterized protein PHACADRAFT_266424 [Phanerochaete carnosa HHB-10118-sp]|uniref:Uncharacterized protein n=1 Tax=Phanerochaete carnosa (strain HHB-10118-sp) TaxID=650164 RepID=K5VB87_PHACS|nr:uncharacterized protein PHACADRAFT_266424 [Phanerochaete carnosa HHB-10118-sp]EKM48313.1 hypothetical protein PHACADRAFT_266424 [Phanerochaete carnosa HHB-10118-sp]
MSAQSQQPVDDAFYPHSTPMPVLCPLPYMLSSSPTSPVSSPCSPTGPSPSAASHVCSTAVS